MKLTVLLSALALGASLSGASLSSSAHAAPGQGVGGGSLDVQRRHAHARLAQRHAAQHQHQQRGEPELRSNITSPDELQQLFKRGGKCNGHATWYDTQTGNAGACGSMLSNGDYTVALAQPGWGNLNQRFKGCYDTITISANGKSHTARIVDACPTGGGNCGSACDLDMSPALFKFFAPQSVGKMEISWSYGNLLGDVLGGLGGGKGGGDDDDNDNNGGGGGNNDDDDDDDQEGRRVAAMASKAAAASASRASASAAASRSSASASRASVSAAAKSKASVAASKSRKAAASRTKAAKAKASASKAAKAAAASYKAAPKNVMNLNRLVDAYGLMAAAAQ